MIHTNQIIEIVAAHLRHMADHQKATSLSVGGLGGVMHLARSNALNDAATEVENNGDVRAKLNVLPEVEKLKQCIDNLTRALSEQQQWREKFNQAIIDFDARYAGWHYLESAVDAVGRAKRMEAALREIVAKLPKTADGVPIVPGMKVWVASDPVRSAVVAEVHEGWFMISSPGSQQYGNDVSYSTREAARNALAGGEGKP